MAKIINPEWQKNIQTQLKEGSFKSTTTGYTPAAKWLIHALSEKCIPFKTINLGAGVRKIIITKNLCPTCKGKGVV